jgi:hypothetical protein
MKARQAISSASFEPRELATIGTAFDDAWAGVAHHFATVLAKDAARLVLANAVLDRASSGAVQYGPLKRAGLAALADRYPSQLPRSSPVYFVALIEESKETIANSRVRIAQLQASIGRARVAIRKSLDLLPNNPQQLLSE